MQSFLFVDKSNNLEYVWTLSCREDRDFCIVTTLLLHCDVSVLSPSVLKGQWKRCKRQLEILHPLYIDWNKGSFIHYCTCRVGENLDITQNVCWFGFFFAFLILWKSSVREKKPHKTPPLSSNLLMMVESLLGKVYLCCVLFPELFCTKLLQHEDVGVICCFCHQLYPAFL